ncbi:hypothetical protein PR048_004206 [Dryococelus australis]|uniref:Uncharacterized protein n=1 Tax=Dryococelus australis TaxID=614101 RepID=A0ABQ9I4V0_9NEOP|nr:hypothetical protein PR048_004206 [Dryococelus australis]
MLICIACLARPGRASEGVREGWAHNLRSGRRFTKTSRRVPTRQAYRDSLNSALSYRHLKTPELLKAFKATWLTSSDRVTFRKRLEFDEGREESFRSGKRDCSGCDGPPSCELRVGLRDLERQVCRDNEPIGSRVAARASSGSGGLRTASIATVKGATDGRCVGLPCRQNDEVYVGEIGQHAFDMYCAASCIGLRTLVCGIPCRSSYQGNMTHEEVRYQEVYLLASHVLLVGQWQYFPAGLFVTVTGTRGERARLHSPVYTRASDVCSLAAAPVLPHTWQYKIRYLFPYKFAIGSEASRACLMNYDPIAKSGEAWKDLGDSEHQGFESRRGRGETSMKQGRNARAGETGENSLTSGIVRHDSHLRKSGSDLAESRTKLIFGGYSTVPGTMPDDLSRGHMALQNSWNFVDADQILAKSKYRNRTWLERASQKQSSDTHKTPYDRVKRCRERKINIKASERVNVDVFTLPFQLVTSRTARPLSLGTQPLIHSSTLTPLPAQKPAAIFVVLDMTIWKVQRIPRSAERARSSILPGAVLCFMATGNIHTGLARTQHSLQSVNREWSERWRNAAHVPGVKEDELEVEGGAEHEHVAVQLDLGDGAGRQRVSHGDEAHVLVATVVGRAVQGELLHLEVARAVDHLPHTTTHAPRTIAALPQLIASHLDEPGSIRGGIAPRFSHPQLVSPSSALKTSTDKIPFHSLLSPNDNMNLANLYSSVTL